MQVRVSTRSWVSFSRSLCLVRTCQQLSCPSLDVGCRGRRALIIVRLFVRTRCLSRSTMESTGERIVCMAQSSDGILLAWGTEQGFIIIVNTDTGDQLAAWKGHHGPVEAMCFSPSNTVLCSCGIDLRPSIPMQEYMLLSPDAQEALPRKGSVINWDLERWIMLRMKKR